jgi:ADP-heptose:LPS heptosyltransferase
LNAVQRDQSKFFAALIPLVVRFGRVGDMVLQTPLFHLLGKRFGQPCQLLTSGPWSSELFASDPDVGEIWQLHKRHRPLIASPERWRLIGTLRRHQGPVYVSEDVAQHVRQIRRLLQLAGRGQDRCLYLLDQPSGNDHWVERLLAFGACTPCSIRSEDFPVSPSDLLRAPRLHVDAAARRDRDVWLRDRGFAGRPLVLVQIGNKRSSRWTASRWGAGRKPDPKAWPIDRWIELLRFMRRTLPEACLLLCGSRNESATLRQISAASASRADIATSDLPLRRLLALMEIAHSMVAVDTGPAHMAAAMGCPLVVLYGNESPQVWGRRSPGGTAVIELGGPPHIAASEIPLSDVIHSWGSLSGRGTADRTIAS